MKVIFGFLLVLISFSAIAVQDGAISGAVNLPSALSNKLTTTGALFVFAKKSDSNGMLMNGQPPVAVVKIVAPKFPQRFSISAKNAMMGATSFDGPYHILARYSPTGDPISSSDSLEAATANQVPIKVGTTNVNLTLTAKIRNSEIKIPMH
jgi:hypothetical protein